MITINIVGKSESAVFLGEMNHFLFVPHSDRPVEVVKHENSFQFEWEISNLILFSRKFFNVAYY